MTPKEFATFLLSNYKGNDYDSAFWVLLSLFSVREQFIHCEGIKERTEKVVSRVLDSLGKPSGIVSTYDKTILNSDGTVTPFRGIVYLMDLLDIKESDRLIKYPDYNERIHVMNTQ